MLSMTNNENTIKSADVSAPKKTPVKKVVKEKESIDVSQSDPLGNIVIYLQSGSGYITTNGLKFDNEHKMHELPYLEANLLLRLENFRLATDEEKELYYNTIAG